MEKKLTKYELKQQKREEMKKQSTSTKLVHLGVYGSIILCLGAIAWNKYDNYQLEHGTYVRVGEHDIKRAEYDYYFQQNYQTFVSQYGSYLSYFGLDTSAPLNQQYYSEEMTWKDYFDEQTVTQIQNIYALSDAAKQAGFEYDAQAEYDEFMASVTEAASAENISEEAYLQTIYGDEISMKDIEKYVMQTATAYAYYDDVYAAIEVEDAEIQKYYDENKDDYDVVDYKICEIKANIPEVGIEESSSETDETESETEETLTAEEQEALEKEKEAAKEEAMALAKEQADALLSSLEENEDFDKIAPLYSGDDANQMDKKAVSKSSIMEEAVAEWLFESDRAADDKTIIEDYEAGVYYVVCFDKRYLEHNPTVDVRHILISSATEEETEEAKEEAKKSAKLKAEEIYKNWKDNDPTEDSFADLAVQFSDDTNSAVEGGLCEATTKGSTVANFDSWIFDDARQSGDSGIIETEYGYHIMYFVGDNDEEWYVNIKNTLLNTKSEEYMEELKANYEIKDVRGQLNYLTIETEE